MKWINDYYFVRVQGIYGNVTGYRVFKLNRFKYSPLTALTYVMEKLDRVYGEEGYAIIDFKRI